MQPFNNMNLREQAAKAASEEVSPITQFTKLWVESYQKELGVKYLHQGAKDALAIKRLIAVEPNPEHWMALARTAWDNRDKFWCKQALTIAGFASKINEIRGEIGALSKPVNHSNDW
jgi:hypothetical protein